MTEKAISAIIIAVVIIAVVALFVVASVGVARFAETAIAAVKAGVW